jgi:hypothetical protein
MHIIEHPLKGGSSSLNMEDELDILLKEFRYVV